MPTIEIYPNCPKPEWLVVGAWCYCRGEAFDRFTVEAVFDRAATLLTASGHAHGLESFGKLHRGGDPGAYNPISVWTEKTPAEDGWFWIKYKNKRNKYTVCPCLVIHNSKTTMVTSAKNDTFYEGPNHGGKGLKYGGKIDTSVRFGPKIELPPEEEK